MIITFLTNFLSKLMWCAESGSDNSICIWDVALKLFSRMSKIFLKFICWTFWPGTNLLTASQYAQKKSYRLFIFTSLSYRSGANVKWADLSLEAVSIFIWKSTRWLGNRILFSVWKVTAEVHFAFCAINMRKRELIRNGKMQNSIFSCAAAKVLNQWS